jgi:hypothetical protein
VKFDCNACSEILKEQLLRFDPLISIPHVEAVSAFALNVRMHPYRAMTQTARPFCGSVEQKFSDSARANVLVHDKPADFNAFVQFDGSEDMQTNPPFDAAGDLSHVNGVVTRVLHFIEARADLFRSAGISKLSGQFSDTVKVAWLQAPNRAL